MFSSQYFLAMPSISSPLQSVVLIANAVAISCALLSSSNAWAAPQMKAPDSRETRGLRAYLDSNDCPGAVQTVKAGIRARQPDVLLMAGTMIEEGVCMKADWEKAITVYEMAHQEGSPSAWPAIIAALAVPGRDNGRALWYAAQSGLPKGLPPGCIPSADPIKELDAFNTQLERMPPELFKACVYMLGVTNEVLGHVQFPPIALHYGVQGNLTMKFTPASGTITWTFEQTADSKAGFRDMSKDQFDDERKIDKILLTYVTAKGKFALGRYARPDDIDPGIVLSSMFVFTITN
jgi:hypothetical protein